MLISFIYIPFDSPWKTLQKIFWKQTHLTTRSTTNLQKPSTPSIGGIGQQLILLTCTWVWHLWRRTTWPGCPETWPEGTTGSRGSTGTHPADRCVPECRRSRRSGRFRPHLPSQHPPDGPTSRTTEATCPGNGQSDADASWIFHKSTSIGPHFQRIDLPLNQSFQVSHRGRGGAIV